MSSPDIVCGVDLSTTGLGLVAVPEDWGLDWSKLAFETLVPPEMHDAPPWQVIGRLMTLVEGVVDFVQRNDVTHVWIESLPTHGGQTYSAGKLEQVGGAVRYALRRDCRLNAWTSPIATARKLVMGKMPRRDVKATVHATVRSFSGVPFGTGDEIDAFVAANYGMSLIGGCFVAAPQEPPQRARRASR